MNHEDRLLASALNQLSPAEEAEFQRDREANPALQREWQELHDSLGTLLDDLDLERVSMPADAEERLIARLHAEGLGAQTDSAHAGAVPQYAVPERGVPDSATGPSTPLREHPRQAGEPTTRRPAWWLALPLSLAAAVALLFALRPPTDPVQQYANTPGAVSTPVMASGQALGTLIRLADGRVFVHLTRPAAAGRTYQLWQIRAGVPVPLGVFGGAGLLTTILPPGATVAVTVEPPGGSPQPTTKPLFAQAI